MVRWFRGLTRWQQYWLVSNTILLLVGVPGLAVLLFHLRPLEPLWIVSFVVLMAIGWATSGLGRRAMEGFLAENRHLERWVRRDKGWWWSGWRDDELPGLPIGAVLLWRLFKRGARATRRRIDMNSVEPREVDEDASTASGPR